MIYTSAIMTEASGSLRGIVGSHNKGGQYFRGKTIPKNPRSTVETSRRSRLASIATRWENVLTPVQRQAWSDYAAGRSLGGHKVSGLNEYVAINSVSGVVFPSIYRDTAPTIFTTVSILSASLDAINHTTGDVTFTYACPPGFTTATSRVLLFLTKPQNPWTKPHKTMHFIGAVLGSAAATVTLPGAYTNTSAAGQVVYGHLVLLGPVSDTRTSPHYQVSQGIT